VLSSTDVLPGVPGNVEEWFGVLLKIIAAILLGIWFVLVLLGKGGFVHILLLNGLGVAAVEAMTIYRTRMTS
jgi:hypothetical protein